MSEMLPKKFSELTMKEKWQLQSLMKKTRSGGVLSPDEQLLYDRFASDFKSAEADARARWPVIIALLIGGLLGVWRSC